jgi:hypothetical protein
VARGAHPAVRPGTQVLIHKPTIIDGVWGTVPTVVRIVRGRIVEEWLPKAAPAAKEVGAHLAVLVLTGPALFLAADWLRYG